MGAMTTCRLKRSPAARKRSTWTNIITRSACVHSTPISKCSRYSSWLVIKRTFRFAVVIRCLLRPSNELRRAMETLNRYIDGGRKRDPTTDLHRIENPNAKYGLVPHGSHAVGRIAGDTPATTALRLRQPPLHSGFGDWGQSSLLTLGLPV